MGNMAVGFAEADLRQAPAVSVIVPTLNTENSIEACLSSVNAQKDSSLEVLVIDSLSSDRTAQVARTMGATVVSESLGRSSARRLGARLANGRFLFFLDSDQTMEPGLIRECLDITRESKTACVVVPEHDFAIGIWGTCNSLDRRIAAVQDLSYPRFLSKECYWAVGGHSEALQDFMEDRDLYLRLKAHGCRMIASRTRLVNHMGDLNPLTVGLKGFRTAHDSTAFYRMNLVAGESLRSVIRPRLTNLVRPGVLRPSDIPALCFLPLYMLVAHGPRLLRASKGRHGAARGLAAVRIPEDSPAHSRIR